MHLCLGSHCQCSCNQGLPQAGLIFVRRLRMWRSWIQSLSFFKITFSVLNYACWSEMVCSIWLYCVLGYPSFGKAWHPPTCVVIIRHCHSALRGLILQIQSKNQIIFMYLTSVWAAFQLLQYFNYYLLLKYLWSAAALHPITSISPNAVECKWGCRLCPWAVPQSTCSRLTYTDRL